MSPEQSKAARAVLGWNVDDTAAHASINKNSVLNFENRINKPHNKTIERLQGAYEAAGVLFTNDGLSITWRTPDAAQRKA